MKNFLTNFPFREVSVFVTIVVSFTYNVLLDRDVLCTCQPEVDDCDMYISMPPCVIFFLILWTDKSFHRSCRYLCTCTCVCRYACPAPAEQQDQGNPSCCRPRFLGRFVSCIFKAGLVGSLWVISVLIDGDWYVCCRYDHIKYPQLACRDKTNLTAVERVEVAKLHNWSRFFGFSVILGILIFTTVMAVLGECNSCIKKCFDRKTLYDHVIMDEEGVVLEDYLREKAKDDMKEKMRIRTEGGEWRKCFDAAEELMDSEPTVRVPDQRNDEPGPDQEVLIQRSSPPSNLSQTPPS